MGTFIVVAVVMAVVGYFIGNSKGRPTEGAILGGLLGLVGIIILVCLKPKQESVVGYQFPATAFQSSFPPALPPASHWVQDPYGRHEYRWWDGREWSNQVSDRGVQTVDPIGPLALSRPY